MREPDPSLPTSIETLYGDHHPWLRAWLQKRLGHAADAADLAQDAFIRLLRKPRPFHSFLEARVYLRKMANGLCIDLWRRRQIEQAWLEVLASQPEAYAVSSEHQCMVLEALQEVDAMLRHLPPKVSSAFVMAVGCGMTDRQVAEELGVSDRMVRKYVAKAMLHCLQLEMDGLAALPEADIHG